MAAANKMISLLDIIHKAGVTGDIDCLKEAA